MRRFTWYGTLGVLGLLFFTGCSKNIQSLNSGVQVNAGQTKDYIPAYPFSWQTADFVATPPGSSSILVPWASGANEQYDAQDMAFDYASTDGWTLVYNTFNTVSLTSPEFFALYNIYRGLYRLYLYVPDGVTQASTYLAEGLSFVGSGTSSMLNFAGQDVVNVGTNQPSVYEVAPYQLDATGAWYVCQFEMAYDPNIPNIAYQNLQTIWSLSAINVEQNTLDGMANSTIMGTIATTQNPANLGTSAVTGVLEIAGLFALSALTGDIPVAVLTALKAAVSSALGGTIKNVLSGIFGGNSSYSSQVDLTVNTTISLAGTTTSSLGIATPTLIIPGTQWSANNTTAGYVPAYNEPLGVFNMTGTPTINYTETTSGTGFTNLVATYRYSIAPGTVNLVFNPAVTSVATITNIQEQIVAFVPEPFASNISYNGTYETIGNRNAYTSIDFVQGGLGFSAPLQFGVRVIFTVKPNNGAASSTIVETFAANLVKT